MYKRISVFAWLILSVMLLLTMPVMAQQSNRLVFTLHAEGSSLVVWSDGWFGQILEWYVAEGVFNFAGTSLVEETEEYEFPVYILEEGSVHAAGNLYIEWIADDGSHHELKLRLFGTEETSGGYFMEEEGDPTHPWGLCGMFIPQPFTYQGWHTHDGIREGISGNAGVLAGCHTKAPDYTGTLIEKWWIVWVWLEIDGNIVAVQFAELAFWWYPGQWIWVPAAQVLEVQIRLI